jgi:sugar phosphate isomerase/epimerase
MNPSRRKFIKKSALTITTAAISSKLFGWNASPQLTGVQLYSVRDEMKADPLGTLKQLAAMGYKYVEHANYVNRKFYGWSAQEFRKVLDDLGMQMPSGHTVLGKAHWNDTVNDFTDAWKYTVDDAAVCGQQVVISPSLDKTWRDSESAVSKTMDIFNKSGELCKKAGMRFGYHNHDFEFSEKFGERSLYDLILEKTDPTLGSGEEVAWPIPVYACERRDKSQRG